MYYHNNQLIHSKSIDLAHVSDISREHFSEYDILALNDLLLSGGIHKVTVHNLVIGRKIMQMFLALLNYYNQIYWLSLQKGDCLLGHQDLYYELKKYGCLKNVSHGLFECYFYDAFHGDCLIIEQTEQIESAQWYNDLIDFLRQSCFITQMPIVFMLPSPK